MTGIKWISPWLVVFASLLGVGMPTAAWSQVADSLGVPATQGMRSIMESYSSVDAAQEAYQRAEAQRAQSIHGQVQTEARIGYYASRPAYAYPYAAGVLGYAPGAVAYGGYAYLPRRGVWAYRGPSYPYAALQLRVVGPPGIAPSWSMLTNRLYSLPYPSRVAQPSGHTITPTGPNGYVYRPAYGAPVPPAAVVPAVVGEQPAASPILEAPVVNPPVAVAPGAEPIPTPPAEAGPMEF